MLPFRSDKSALFEGVLKGKNMLKKVALVAALLCTGCEHSSSVSLGEAGQKTSESLLKVARTMTASGDLSTASRLYRQALTLDPDNHVALRDYAALLRHMNQLEEALEVAERCALKNPTCPFVMKEKGAIYLAKQNPVKARALFEEALKKRPDDVAALNAMGVSYDLEGDHQAAQQYYDKVLTLKPNDPNAVGNKALSVAFEGRFSEALPVLEKRAKRMDATFKDRENLALVYGLAGQYQKARDLYATDMTQAKVQGNIAYLETLRTSMQRSISESASSDLTPDSLYSGQEVGGKEPSSTSQTPREQTLL